MASHVKSKQDSWAAGDATGNKTLMSSPFVLSRVSPKWFVIFTFCQGTALIGQGRLCHVFKKRAGRKTACARLRSHGDVTLLKCKDLLLAGTHLMHYGSLLL